MYYPGMLTIEEKRAALLVILTEEGWFDAPGFVATCDEDELDELLSDPPIGSQSRAS
jgi:hypothetical protein